MNKFRFLLGAIALAMLPLHAAHAEDTDIFRVNPDVDSGRPNILIILDNTANWSNPFTSEIAALLSVFNGIVDDKYNVGLMLFTETGSGSTVNKCGASFLPVGNAGIDGAFVRRALRQMTLANRENMTCTIRNFDSGIDRSNGGKAGTAMYEAHRYLSGGDSVAGGPPSDAYPNHKAKSDPEAFLTGSARYKTTPTGCARSFIIYISNGAVQDNDDDSRTSAAALKASGGSVDQVNLSPSGSQSNMADEWARFMFGSRGVITYSIDVLPKTTGQGPGWSALLKSMAIQGHGRYFAATSMSTLQADISKALDEIFQEVLPVNSVFASTALPVSNNVRGTYLNQVYLGVFRPDSNSAPNWAGNMKQYQLIADRSTIPPTVMLADSRGQKALDDKSGFIVPSAISYWTKDSSFWNSTYSPYIQSQGAGGANDSPDGELIEKGGAGQALRRAYPTDQAARKVYTCTGSCVSGSSLSATPFATGNSGVVLPGLTGSNRTEVINWIRGGNIRKDDNPSEVAGDIRGRVHGDVIHSRTAVINYGRTSDDVVLFYGAGDGMLHAIKGGRTTTSGDELWSFITPEHFGALKRLYDHDPKISSDNTKPYYIDGSPTFWTSSTVNDGKIDYTRGDKAYLYLTMRRGGRFIYALDVSNPDDPKLLWKHSDAEAGFTTLGQTWSMPMIAKVRARTGPVLFFGMGYDNAANDQLTQGASTKGQGIMMLDALTGAMLWQAGKSVPNSSPNLVMADMTRDVPADLSVLDSNSDGFADRVYAVDTGANIWRFNVNDPLMQLWNGHKVASLGGTAQNARKFLFAPDVVFGEPNEGSDYLLIGSGDREHPFDTNISNRYFSIKDSHQIDYVRETALTEANLFNASVFDGTSATMAPAAGNGWYFNLQTGEKVVGGSTTLNGTVIFGTNVPAQLVAGVCADLGEARLYSVNYRTAAPAFNAVDDDQHTAADRYAKAAGGGLPPTPVPVSVVIDGHIYTVAIAGTNVVSPPGPELNRRYRQYWRRNSR